MPPRSKIRRTAPASPPRANSQLITHAKPGQAPGFVLQGKERVMKITKQITLAVLLGLGATIGAASVASAQSAYTTGTIASSERAGYPEAAAPHSGGLYAYAPGY